MRWRALCCWLLLLTAGLAGAAVAHDVGISQATLAQQPDGRYVLEVSLDAAPADAFAPPVLPARCLLEPSSGALRPGARSLRYVFTCPGQPLIAGDVLRLPWERQGVVVTARWRDGSGARGFFGRGVAGIVVPLAELRAGTGALAVAARRYFGLGVEHILLGLDHLLFVFGLLLLVRGPWQLFKTITAFTLAHSLTLALATFGLVNLPPRTIDAAIALSILFLAVEILHGRQGRSGLTQRFPWLVAFAFGLLHGLGFAGALAAVGLPQAEIPLALLFFNLGVEAGQLMFVAAILSLRFATARLQISWPAWAAPLPAYAIGTIASFWFMQRLAGLAFAS
jgi:HupE / UreJ protein